MEQLRLEIRDKDKRKEFVVTPWIDSSKIGNPKWYIVLTDNGYEVARIPAKIEG